jgi:hypothetical protein
MGRRSHRSVVQSQVRRRCGGSPTVASVRVGLMVMPSTSSPGSIGTSAVQVSPVARSWRPAGSRWWSEGAPVTRDAAAPSVGRCVGLCDRFIAHGVEHDDGPAVGRRRSTGDDEPIPDPEVLDPPCWSWYVAGEGGRETRVACSGGGASGLRGVVPGQSPSQPAQQRTPGRGRWIAPPRLETFSIRFGTCWIRPGGSRHLRSIRVLQAH